MSGYLRCQVCWDIYLSDKQICEVSYQEYSFNLCKECHEKFNTNDRDVLNELKRISAKRDAIKVKELMRLVTVRDENIRYNEWCKERPEETHHQRFHSWISYVQEEQDKKLREDSEKIENELWES